MNFTMKMRDDTHIFTIKDILRERHGKVENLQICFRKFDESNEVKDEMLTLKDVLGEKFGQKIKYSIDEVNRCFIRDESDLPVVPLLYDFRPAEATIDPLLLFKY